MSIVEKRTIRRPVSFTPTEWENICEYLKLKGRYGFGFFVWGAIHEALLKEGVDIRVKRKT